MPSNGNIESCDVRHARDSQGESADPGIAKTLSELARELRQEPDLKTLLQHIVAATVDELDGADYGGITLAEGRRVRAEAASDPRVEHLDTLQNTLGEGPCLSSLREQVTVRTDDLASDERWPRFAAAAVGVGVRSMLSVQLFVEGDNLGALNLYANRPAAFGRADENIAMALAAHAAVAMEGVQVESNLRIALGSRDLIGQAKGVLMERYKIDAEEAFELIVMASQRTHRKLRDVAADLAMTGELRVT